MPIKVLLVDDSAVVRGLMVRGLADAPEINIVGRASDGIMAIKNANMLQPDVIILDIEMPNMDGISALPELLKVSPKSKIIMASTLTLRNASISLKALSLGAADYIPKPSATAGDELTVFYRDLISKIRALSSAGSAIPAQPELKSAGPAPAQQSAAKPVVQSPQLAPVSVLNATGVSALAIAASTGGPQALLALFTQLKGRLKNVPIFITQHMPPIFTTILAEQLSKAGDRICTEAKNGEIAESGHVYIAPGNFHMVAEKDASGKCVISVNQDAQENFCRPSADPMLRSLSKVYGANLAVAVLTGMGQDGMEGAKVVVNNGGSVIVQDEASCVVYSMPKAIVDHNLCKAILPLAEMGSFLIRHIDGTKA